VSKALGLTCGPGAAPGIRTGRPRRPVRVQAIMQIACATLGVTIEELMGKGRHKRVVLTRAVTVLLARELTKLFETVLDGDLAGLLAKVEADENQRKGEFVVMVQGAGDDELIAHCRQVADEIPIMGFYLQTAVGGQHLGFDFWRRFAAIENVIAIKMAPFDRYRTLDVVRGIVAANAEERVTLYTGNDDNIVLDLLAPFTMMRGGNPVTVRIKGGLLGHWSVWTKAAVDQFARIKAADGLPTPELLALHAQVTDSNAAFFDVLGGFKGCIAGCHEVLRRQGLLEGRWCLNEDEDMGAGQVEEIERVYAAYPHLNDDAFVARNLARWLA